MQVLREVHPSAVGGGVLTYDARLDLITREGNQDGLLVVLDPVGLSVEEARVCSGRPGDLSDEPVVGGEFGDHCGGGVVGGGDVGEDGDRCGDGENVEGDIRVGVTG